MKINEENFWNEFNEIDSWDDWDDFKKKFFDENRLAIKSDDEWERSLNRGDEFINGLIWHAACCGYKDLHAYFLLDKSRALAFKKLEPEAFANNATKPELYGQICYHCEIWTRSHQPKACPVCNGELLQLPLNEK
ncbi:hypothetical protein F2P44_31925 [Massilia sp. CCM 8695]|uniref:DUF4240 domain-containing protein n=1 Tax=Massilia frigida TaxID=2609281 RepID=A0ABX0NJQ6_9BURK|nr:hypothetical protein [Massilia frigida]NHZ83843.1 hypothetical protein [Massilia frigida]